MDESERYSTIMWEIVQEAFDHANKSSHEIGKDESLHDFFRLKVVEKFPETEKDYEKKRRILMQISEMWGAFVGSPIEKQSLKFFWLEECLEGGKFPPPSAPHTQ